MDLQSYQTGVYFLVSLSFFLFALLDGFDLGIGLLLPFARTREDSGRLVSHIAPFWDGNEIWLIIAGALVFAAYPVLLGMLLGAIYLPFLLFIAGLIVRAMALEYSYHDPARQRLWHLAAAGGSGLASGIALYALGVFLLGLPFESAGVLSQHPADYAAPFPLLVTLAGWVILAWHGLTYALSRAPAAATPISPRTLWWGAVSASLALLIGWIIWLPQTLRHPSALIGIACCAAGIAGARLFLQRPGWAFRFSCLTLTGLWTLITGSLYPAVLPARLHPEWTLTIASDSAPAATLKLLLTLGLILVPIIIAYTWFIHRVLCRPKNRSRNPADSLA
jgi:cytochrome d ubiquinol oxidase subunit II